MLGISSSTDVHADDVAHRISQIRNQQWCASYAEYIASEHEIQQLRGYHDGDMNMSRWNMVVAYLHAVPWIVWQILLILTAILLGIYLPYIWSFRFIFVTIMLAALCGLLATIVWHGHYEQNREVVVVHHPQACVYVGPAATYPTHGTLSYLDEAEIQERLEDWIKVRYPNGYGWIQRNDVTYVS